MHCYATLGTAPASPYLKPRQRTIAELQRRAIALTHCRKWPQYAPALSSACKMGREQVRS